MRHSMPATTTDVYTQELPESIHATINSVRQQPIGATSTQSTAGPTRSAAIN